jgi:hypothetical protein
LENVVIIFENLTGENVEIFEEKVVDVTLEKVVKVFGHTLQPY